MTLNEEDYLDEMSAQELSSLIQRLEAVAVRLESAQGGAGAAAGRKQKKTSCGGCTKAEVILSVASTTSA